MFDLNTVAVPPTGWRFVTVRGISNDGVLVGNMALDTDSVIRRGFLANGGVPCFHNGSRGACVSVGA